MTRLVALAPDDALTPFPPVSQALDYPNGLLAVGGALSTRRLLMAYRQGIFPWFSPGQPPLWWSPDPRAVFVPGQMHISRSLRKALRRNTYRVTLDEAFPAVIGYCADLRAATDGTWIGDDMREAYTALYRQGLAHSVEVWVGNDLAGGLYGISLGAAFFGESMFSRRSDASKIALAWLHRQLLRWHYELIDCQVSSPHLARLGAQELPREVFLTALGRALQRRTLYGPWQLDQDLSANEVAGG